MYRCNRCQALFETPGKTTVIHYEVDTRQKETVHICPGCRSEDFEEVTLCKGCNTNYIKSHQDYCSDCYLDVTKAINELAQQKGLPFADTLDLVEAYFERVS